MDETSGTVAGDGKPDRKPWHIIVNHPDLVVRYQIRTGGYIGLESMRRSGHGDDWRTRELSLHVAVMQTIITHAMKEGRREGEVAEREAANAAASDNDGRMM